MILVTQGYSYREVGRILLVDEESVSEWVTLTQATGLDSLKNHCSWGGEHGQRFLSTEQLSELKQTLAVEAMAGTKPGSGWSAKAIRKLIRDQYATS
jgi:transposase